MSTPLMRACDPSLPYVCPKCHARSPVQVHGHKTPTGGPFDPYCTEPFVLEVKQ